VNIQGAKTIDIDKKLEKLLRTQSVTKIQAETAKYEAVVKTLLDGQNSLLTAPAGVVRTAHILAVVNTILSAKKRIGWITPELTAFRAMQIRLDTPTALMTVWQQDEIKCREAPLTLWSLEVFRDYLPKFFRQGVLFESDILIFDDVECINVSKTGSLLEEVLLRLPGEHPLLLCLAPVSNTQELRHWLVALRQCECQEYRFEDPIKPPVPVFLTAEERLLPLLDKKRVSNKVKQVVKKEPPRSPHGKEFIRQLSAVLSAAQLLPALVIMHPAACAMALLHCPKHKHSPKILEIPEVMALFAEYPWLQKQPRLAEIQAKRAMDLSENHHPVWNRLAEMLLSAGAIDLLFAPLSMAKNLIVPVKTVVLLTAQYSTSEGTDEWLTQTDLATLLKLAGGPEVRGAGCILIAHTREMDVVHIRDLLTAKPSPLIGHLECNTRTALGLLTQSNPFGLLTGSFSAHQYPAGGDIRLLDLLAELQAELPEAQCMSPRAVIELRDLYLNLEFQINAITHRRERRRSGRYHYLAQHQLRELEAEFARLPCHDCAHQHLCHQRGPRHMRTLVDEYYTLQHRLPGSMAFLHMEFTWQLAGLQALDLTDESGQLTAAGWVALDSGLGFPHILAACVQQNILPLDDPYLAGAVLGGFIECPEEEQPALVSDFVASELDEIYAEIHAALPALQERLLRAGISARLPSLAQSAVLLVWQGSGDAGYIAKRAGISTGALVRLSEKSHYLLSRIRARQKRLSSSTAALSTFYGR
jgi:hypothetical protein